MKFQTMQPHRLLEDGRIVPSADTRDFPTFWAWFMSQPIVVNSLVAIIWALTAVVVLLLALAGRYAYGFVMSLVAS